MPSYVIHLACGKRILQACKPMNPEQEEHFYIGCIAADMVKDKRYSHFWDDETYRLLERKPNLEMFLDRYGGNLSDPYVFGYYTHLYLDRMFLKQYWEKHFTFYNEHRQPENGFDAVRYVEVKEQKRIYEREQFFSKEYYYGDYDRMNSYFATTYDLRFPNPDSIRNKRDGYRTVREIDWDESLPILEKAIDCVQHSLQGHYIETQKPPLNIFLLPELERLLDSAAKEMARQFA